MATAKQCLPMCFLGRVEEADPNDGILSIASTVSSEYSGANHKVALRMMSMMECNNLWCILQLITMGTIEALDCDVMLSKNNSLCIILE